MTKIQASCWSSCLSNTSARCKLLLTPPALAAIAFIASMQAVVLGCPRILPHIKHTNWVLERRALEQQKPKDCAEVWAAPLGGEGLGGLVPVPACTRLLLLSWLSHALSWAEHALSWACTKLSWACTKLSLNWAEPATAPALVGLLIQDELLRLIYLVKHAWRWIWLSGNNGKFTKVVTPYII